MITKNEVLDNLEEVKKYVSEIETKKEGIAILNRYNDEVIFQSTKTTMKEAVEEAVEKYANLKSANLKSANLESANLKSANLESANLKDANLKSAKTTYCTINFASSEKEQAEQFIKGL